MTPPKEFTQAQRDAVQKAYDILSEQFPSAVVIVEAEVDAEEPGEPDERMLYWTISGGMSAAVGMAQRMCARIMDPD